MEHPLSPLSSLTTVRPWRTATLVASAIAFVELVALVVAGVALLGKPLSRHAREVAIARVAAPIKKSLPPVAPPTGKPKLARGQTSVIVFNGSGVTGAAAAAGDRVKARGYIVSGVGNAPRGGWGHSVVMYRKGYRAEALRLARDVRIKIVSPLDGLKASELMGAHLALIVGT